MAQEQIKLRAKAKSLGVENYRSLTTAELEAAIKSAERGSSGGGRKTANKTAQKNASDNGKTGGRKSAAKTAVKTAGGRKKAPAKRAKSAPAKSASTGAKAKRQTTGGKTAPAKRQTARSNADGVGRMDIDNGRIDWQAEWGGGKSGNRKLAMDALRRFKGDTDKIFNHLVGKAQTMFPKTNDGRKRSKADAERLLSWFISRVKFDFVTQTGQHQGVVRSKSGPNANAGRQAPAPRKASRKAATGKRGPQKRAGGRKKASTAKRSTGKKGGSRSSGRRTARRR